MIRLRGPLTGIAAILSVVAAAPGTGAAQEPMSAALIRQFGPPEVLQVEQIPRPEPGAGEILVRVHAAGVNPVDASVRSGRSAGMVGARLPYVPGFDIAGVVVGRGPGVTAFQPGDEIFALIDLRRGGGYAEYAVVKVEEAALKPATASWAEAASLPLVALTAWQALFETGGLEAGQTVLIHAGAGGVGSVAVQLARWRGARVLATASPANHAFLRELGADVVIDYNTERFEDVAAAIDLVLDPIGGDTQARSMGVLKEGGILVSLVGLTPEARSPEHDAQARSILVRPEAAQLRRIGELVDEAHVRPIVSHVFPLGEAPSAHEQSETRHTRGKIVLEVSGGR